MIRAVFVSPQGLRLLFSFDYHPHSLNGFWTVSSFSISFLAQSLYYTRNAMQPDLINVLYFSNEALPLSLFSSLFPLLLLYSLSPLRISSPIIMIMSYTLDLVVSPLSSLSCPSTGRSQSYGRPLFLSPRSFYPSHAHLCSVDLLANETCHSLYPS